MADVANGGSPGLATKPGQETEPRQETVPEAVAESVSSDPAAGGDDSWCDLAVGFDAGCVLPDDREIVNRAVENHTRQGRPMTPPPVDAGPRTSVTSVTETAVAGTKLSDPTANDILDNIIKAMHRSANPDDFQAILDAQNKRLPDKFLDVVTVHGVEEAWKRRMCLSSSAIRGLRQEAKLLAFADVIVENASRVDVEATVAAIAELHETFPRSSGRRLCDGCHGQHPDRCCPGEVCYPASFGAGGYYAISIKHGGKKEILRIARLVSKKFREKLQSENGGATPSEALMKFYEGRLGTDVKLPPYRGVNSDVDVIRIIDMKEPPRYTREFYCYTVSALPEVIATFQAAVQRHIISKLDPHEKQTNQIVLMPHDVLAKRPEGTRRRSGDLTVTCETFSGVLPEGALVVPPYAVAQLFGRRGEVLKETLARLRLPKISVMHTGNLHGVSVVMLPGKKPPTERQIRGLYNAVMDAAWSAQPPPEDVLTVYSDF